MNINGSCAKNYHIFFRLFSLEAINRSIDLSWSSLPASPPLSDTIPSALRQSVMYNTRATIDNQTSICERSAGFSCSQPKVPVGAFSLPLACNKIGFYYHAWWWQSGVHCSSKCTIVYVVSVFYRLTKITTAL